MGRPSVAALLTLLVIVACSRTPLSQRGPEGLACNQCALCVSGRCNRVVQVAAASHHTCARLAEGEVMCWGSNTSGILGTGRVGSQANPTPQPIALPEPAIEIAVSTTHACAVLESGAVSCWGKNDELQLGHGNLGVPGRVPNLRDATHVGAGDSFSCASTPEGAFCWGKGAEGALGDGQESPSTSEPQALAIPDPVTSFALGRSHGCAVTTKREIWCWGKNTDGQISGARGSIAPPTRISPLDWVESASARVTSTCAIPISGVPLCWGDGVAVPSELRGAADVSAMAGAESLVCALGKDGSVRCGSVKLGDFDAPELRFQKTLHLGDAVAIAAGTHHVCAIREDGTLECWGQNPIGQLGDGTTAARSFPAPVVWPSEAPGH